MMNTMQRLTTAIRYCLYPLLLASSLLVIYGAVKSDWDLKHTLWIYLSALLVVLIFIERRFPLARDGGMTRSSFLRDLQYLLTSAVTIGLVRGGFGALTIWMAERHRGPLAQASVVTSVVVFLVVFEFLQYWFHRTCHEGRGKLGSFLWRVHLAHHLPDRVYVVMHAVFHPINALVTATLLQVTMLGLGLSPQAAFAVMVLVDLQTMISHFNVDVRAGFLNYVFIGNELHRYHHSTEIDEAKNYGSILALWDIVFGTFLYRPEKHPARLGLDGTGQYPHSRNLVQVLALPFRGDPPMNVEAS